MGPFLEMKRPKNLAFSWGAIGPALSKPSTSTKVWQPRSTARLLDDGPAFEPPASFTLSFKFQPKGPLILASPISFSISLRPMIRPSEDDPTTLPSEKAQSQGTGPWIWFPGSRLGPFSYRNLPSSGRFSFSVLAPTSSFPTRFSAREYMSSLTSFLLLFSASENICLTTSLIYHHSYRVYTSSSTSISNTLGLKSPLVLTSSLAH